MADSCGAGSRRQAKKANETERRSAK